MQPLHNKDLKGPADPFLEQAMEPNICSKPKPIGKTEQIIVKKDKFYFLVYFSKVLIVKLTILKTRFLTSYHLSLKYKVWFVNIIFSL